jgi:hypothetical protein
MSHLALGVRIWKLEMKILNKAKGWGGEIDEGRGNLLIALCQHFSSL